MVLRFNKRNRNCQCIHVTLYYRYRAGYKKFLIDVNADFCAYHDNKMGSGVLDLIREQFKEYSTDLWHPCPYVPGNLSISDLPLTASLVNNLFVPAGDYKLIVDTRIGEERIMIMIFFVVPAGRTLEDDKMG